MSDVKATERADGLRAVGTIEVLADRVYPLDAEATNNTRTEILVEPGTYEVFSDGLATFWMMRGKLNQRGLWRMGDGMFGMSGSDRPSEIEVVFPSRRFGPDEWADLVAGNQFQEGHPAQRLRLRMLDAGSTVSA